MPQTVATAASAVAACVADTHATWPSHPATKNTSPLLVLVFGGCLEGWLEVGWRVGWRLVEGLFGGCLGVVWRLFGGCQSDNIFF